MLEHSRLKKIVSALALITMGLVVAAGIVFWLLVSQKNASSGQQEGATTAQQNDALRRKYQTILEKTKKDRATLDDYVIAGDADTARLLGIIEELATTSALTLSQTVSIEKISSKQEALALTLEVKGNFQNTMIFLRALETLPHELVFRGVDLRRSSEVAKGNIPWTLRIALSIKSFKR